MFKDTDKELARLAEELLKAEQEDEAEETEEYEEDYEDFQDDEQDFEEEFEEEEDEAPPEYIYDDTRAAQGPAVYQNYSNDYGRSLRNYASGYHAYNSDDCDEDLDAFSDEVYEEEPQERSNTGLMITACVLAAILGVVVLLMVLKYKGVL